MKLLKSKEELNNCLLDIIKKSQKKLIIVSPFINFKSNGKCWDTLIDMLDKKKNILEIYTTSKTEHNENTGVDYMIEKHIINDKNLTSIDNLHAKMYISEKAILLTSMNLVYSSFLNSLEIGVLFENNEKEYSDIVDYFNNIIFIHNKNNIFEYFNKSGIKVKFLLDGTTDEKINCKINYLKLIKNDAAYVFCGPYDIKKDKIKFRIQIMKDGKYIPLPFKYFLKDDKPNKGDYFVLENIYDQISLISVINRTENLLEELKCCYNLL